MRELTPTEQLMDTNRDGKVSKRERRQFREQARETVAQKWGVSYALITQLMGSDDPDAVAFVQWFNSKAAEYIRNPIGFSDSAFVVEFNAQPWAQKYRASAIRDMDFEARFPDIYREEIEGEVEALRDQAARMGATDITDEELMDLAKQRRRFNMNPAQLNNALAELATVKTGDFTGAAGRLQSTLRDWARRNGVSLTDSLIQNYTRRVLAGDVSEEDVLQELRTTYLAGAYPGWADRINAGQDIYDISAPYRQSMAQLLELPDDEITFDDPLLRASLQAVGDDGKPRMMPLYQFEQNIRKDSRWQQTNNAYETYSRLADDILSMFGLG